MFLLYLNKRRRTLCFSKFRGKKLIKYCWIHHILNVQNMMSLSGPRKFASFQFMWYCFKTEIVPGRSMILLRWSVIKTASAIETSCKTLLGFSLFERRRHRWWMSRLSSPHILEKLSALHRGGVWVCIVKTYYHQDLIKWSTLLYTPYDLLAWGHFVISRRLFKI